MNKVKVYDLPTRMFHWLFAGLFVFAFAIAKIIDDDSPSYSYHMLAGIFMLFLVVLRAFWGVVGGHYAKFSSFKLSPSDLVQYFASLLSSKGKRYLGHNPASSFAAIGMFIFTIALAVTGILMSKGINKDFFEEVHEICASGFVITVIIHIIGVIFHQTQHKDGIIYSMINGSKSGAENLQGITSNHNLVATIFLGLVISFAIYLSQNYDSNTQNLDLFGTQIKLGENDHKHSGKKEHSQGVFKSDEHEDD